MAFPQLSSTTAEEITQKERGFNGLSAKRAPEEIGLTRRHFVSASSAATAAGLLSPTAFAHDGGDAELLALRPLWVARRAEFERALNALSAAEGRFNERAPELPNFHAFKGSFDTYCAEHRRITEIHAALELETGLVAAREDENRTSDADNEMVERIFALPARTKEGVRFKREVIADWRDCRREDLTESLLNDLLVMGGFDA